MAKRYKSVKNPKDKNRFSYCSEPEIQERELMRNVNPNRLSLIRMNEKKWVNGTILHYYFFDRLSGWGPTEKEKNVVRKAFDTWKKVGIGLEFKEVSSRDEAEIRIGFMKGDGAWSYLGRDVLEQGRDDRTMNFGWDITGSGEIDTAIHEIGHTLGYPHEHQNPNAGILWDEEAVYEELGGPPNNWPRSKTFHNILRKIHPDLVQGSNWDPDSIMHYPFGPGLIKEPVKFRNGLSPKAGLSKDDKTWVKSFYPPLSKTDYTELEPFKSITMSLSPGGQMNFTIRPKVTRQYSISTFGTADTVMVLFEDINRELRYKTADDDSGQEYNANIKVKLFEGQNYVLRIRLYYADRMGETAVMMW